MNTTQKTIIFLNQSSYNRYNFSELPEIINYRMVAVLHELVYDDFPTRQQVYFDKLYKVSASRHSEKSSIDHVLDYSCVCAIVEQEIALAGGRKNIVLICADESNVDIVGKLRTQYDIDGDRDEQLVLYRDKALMKQRLKEHNIRVPHFVYFDIQALQQDVHHYYQILKQQLGTPFIIKPIKGLGSIATYKINNEDEFIKACPELMKQGSMVDYEADEFISGKLYHCDSLVENGKIFLSICSEYLCPNFEFQQGKILGSIPLPEQWSITQKLTEFNDQVLASLTPISGSTHLEIFEKPDGTLIFLEIAARPVGSLTSANFHRMFHYNIYNNDLLIQLHEKPRSMSKQAKISSLFAIFPAPKAGEIKRLITPKVHGKCHIHWLVKPGDHLTKHSQSIFDGIGYCFISNNNYDRLYTDFESLRNFKHIDLDLHS